jgi:hypothetical protein
MHLLYPTIVVDAWSEETHREVQGTTARQEAGDQNAAMLGGNQEVRKLMGGRVIRSTWQAMCQKERQLRSQQSPGKAP